MIKKLTKSILVAIIILASALILNAQDHYHKGIFRIKFDTNMEATINTMKMQKSPTGVIHTGIASIDKLNEKYSVSNMKRVFPYAGKFEKKHQKYGLHLWYEVIVTNNSDTELATKEYLALNEVSLSELVLKKTIGGTPFNSYKAGVQNSLPGGTNDPQYGDQWHYNNTGQSGGTVDVDIDLPEAWVVQTGDSAIIVSVHDGGIDVDHEDLVGNMWINPNEIAGNGIDDDNNGYIDDIYGYNFGDNTGTIYGDSHGTHVGGTVAAETNNGIGMSGVAGGTGSDDGVRLMSCAVFGNISNGGFPESYIYAADHGAIISQNSWGYTSPNSYEQAVLDAIDYFIAEAGMNENGIQTGPMAGGLVIFAAGNNGSDNLWYPGYYEPVMAVAGTDHNDNKYTSSNFGSWVDLAAPAVNIYSTIPNDNYTGGYNGTSMACPHVSGTAALILSQFKDDDITPQQIWDRLINSTDPLTFTGAEDWGTGRLNTFAALAEDDGQPPLVISDMTIIDVSAVSVTFTWTAPADQPDGYPASIYDFRYSENPITAANFDQATHYELPAPSVAGTMESVEVKGLSVGTTYYFAVKSADYFGNTSDISNTVTATTDQAPDIVITGDPSVTINSSVNPVETGMFTIENQGQAELSYDIFPVYLGKTIPQVQSSLIYPGNEVSIEPEANYSELAELTSSVTTKNHSVIQSYFENEIAHIINYDDGDDEADGSIAVTAGGTPVVWAAATAFDVPDLGGDDFILSHISAYIEAEGSAATNPTSVSIIAGGDNPLQGELIMMQEFNNIIGAEYVNIPLEMPVSFSTGDKFWIVFNFPAAPLRLGYDDVIGGNRPGSYLAYLNGQWADIQNESGWSNYVWTVRAIQTQLHGVTLDISQGTVGVGSAQDISVTFDATDITRNGDHNFNIYILSNDPVTPVEKVQATATVTGIPEPNINIEPDTINSLIDASVNPVKTETLTIFNNGEGELQFDFISPIVEQDFHVDAVIGEYPLGDASESLQAAPYVNPNVNTSLPVVKLAGSIAYAQEVYPNEYFVSLSTDNPGTYLTSSSVSYTAYAGDFAKGDDKHMYIVDDGTSELKKLNIETEELTAVGPTLKFTDLACDKNNGTMYGAFYAEPSSYLYTIDLSSGTATLVGTIGSGIMISIACDGDGNLWGLNLDDNIYSIDKSTGTMTLVGSAGFDANYAQSMAWDPLTNLVYMAAYNNVADRGELRILDTETGASELIGAFAGNAEITAFGFPGGGTTDFITVNPTSGTVEANSSVTVDVELDATVLPNGLYSSSLTVYSNDYDNLSTVVPVNLDVTGQVGEINVSSAFIEFGTVFLNGEKEIPFKIYNTGIGDLQITDIISNQPIFTTDLEDTTVLAMGDTLFVKAKCAPNFLGQFNAILTVKSNDLNNPEVEITVTAAAISPPVISLDPTEIEVTMDAGQVRNEQFTIRNYGMYPLQFSMPEVAANQLLNNPDIEKNNISFIEGITQNTDKQINSGGQGHPVQLGAGGPDELGYSWIDSRETGGPVYNWEEISITGTEILANSDDGSIDIELPFGFKFYGEVKTSAKIGSNGYITFGTDGTDYTNDQIPSTTEPNNYIAPFWDDLRPSSKRGQVFYKAGSDKFIVQYNEVGNYPSSSAGTITFQVVLFPNGNIKYYYKEITLENNASATIGTENEDGTIGLQVAYNTDYIEDNMAVLIFPGRTPFDVSVSPVSGIIQPSSTQVIDLNLDATELLEDSYINELLITSNDPVRPEEIFTTKLDVIGHPEINVSPDSILFSPIFQTLSEVKTITIENTGSKNLTVSNIASDNASFIVDFSDPIMIAPKAITNIYITFTAINIGEEVGTITIESDDEFGNQSYEVFVSGTGLVPPEITVTTNPSPVEITMNSGDIDSINIAIVNSGGSTLNYVMVKPYYTNVGNVSVTTHNPAIELTSKEQPDERTGNAVQTGNGGPDNFGYTWIDSDEGSEVIYDWIEIKNIGTKLDLGADDGTWITLPFNFPFYNETYNEVQIASNGFFTFSEPLGSIGGYSNQDIPTTTEPNNLIAPLWDDIEPQNGDGVYVYSTSEYIIIQYNEVPAFWSTGVGTFQAIVYANGNIKFQYKDMTAYEGIDKATVGIENEDGTDALQVVFNNTYVKDGLAVLIKSPFTVGSVEPGLTANINLIIDATDIYDGTYEAPLKLLSNDITDPSIEIPTTLTIIGTPEISLSSDSVLFNELYFIPGENNNDTEELIVKNDGSKTLLIDSLWFTNETVIFTADKSGVFEIAPKEELIVELTFTPEAVGSFDNIFNIASNDALQPVATTLLFGEAIEPPVIAIDDTDTLLFDLKSTESGTKVSVVSNEGGSLLDYDISIVTLSGQFTNEVQSIYNRPVVNSTVYRSMSASGNFDMNIDYEQSDIVFNDSIVYDPEGAPDDYYGYDGGAPYSSANRFVVNSATFDLTHLTNYYQTGGVTESVILEIYKGGTLPEQGTLLATQTFTHSEANTGAKCLIELESPQSFVQGDVFFVVIHYPQAINFPAAFNRNVSGVDGVSYWYDVNSSTWLAEDPGYVYKIRAFEAISTSPDKWLTVNPVEGELEAGESANHILTANAAATIGGYHYAKVVYSSNDPVTPTTEIPVVMYVNKLPEIISVPDSVVVHEGESIDMMVIATDPEGDALDFELVGTYSFTDLTVNHDTAIVTYSPDYEQAGMFDYVMDITDAQGETITVSWPVIVNNVNRSPKLLTDIDDKMYFVTDPIDQIDLTQYFTDPDGESLIYDAFPSSDTAFSVGINDNMLEITPTNLGYGVITVTATDAEGAYTAASFNVRIRHTENHAPILINDLSYIFIHGSDEVNYNLDDYFTDIDWDEITYSFQVSGVPSVIVSLADNELTLEPTRSGMTFLTLYADDGRGGVTGISLIVFVYGNKNGMPFMLSPIANRTYTLDDNTEKLNLSEYFGDPDQDNLRYIGVIKNGNSVEAIVNDNILEITPKELGESIITIYVSDENTGVVETTFTANVNNSVTGVDDIDITSMGLTNYPNPVKDVTIIEYLLDKACKVKLEVMNIHGETIDILVNETKVEGKYTIDYNVNNLPSGIYFYRITLDNNRIVTKRMIVL